VSLSRRLGRYTLEKDVNRLKSWTADLTKFSGRILPDPLITRNIECETDDTYDIGKADNAYLDVYCSRVFLQTTGEVATLDLGNAGDITDNGSAAAPYILINTQAPDADSAAFILLEAEGPTWRADLVLGGYGADVGAANKPWAGIFLGGYGNSTIRGNVDGFYIFEGDRAAFEKPLELYDYLRHYGDADTDLGFTTDKITLRAGGVTLLELTEAGQDIIHFNSADADVDFQVDTTAGDGALFVEGSTGRVGVNINSSLTGLVHANQNAAGGAIPVLHLEQDDVSEEFIRFTGTAAAGVVTQSIVDNDDVASSTLTGWAKAYVVDEGNQIADQPYFLPLYTLSA
jgi:hypothetical protein